MSTICNGAPSAVTTMAIAGRPEPIQAALIGRVMARSAIDGAAAAIHVPPAMAAAWSGRISATDRGPNTQVAALVASANGMAPA